MNLRPSEGTDRSSEPRVIDANALAFGGPMTFTDRAVTKSTHNTYLYLPLYLPMTCRNPNPRTSPPNGAP